MDEKQKVLDQLNALNISYQLFEHGAVYTMEEMKELGLPPDARIAKNLFLRDAKGRRHFLVVTDADQAIDLKALEGKLGSTRLSFASDDRLQKHLGLTKGSVSPFGLLNDSGDAVEFFVDDRLCRAKLVAVHPNDNTATVLLSGADLMKVIQTTGHDVEKIRFS